MLAGAAWRVQLARLYWPAPAITSWGWGALLSEYSTIFAEPHGLPPPHSRYHNIALVPGSAASVCVAIPIPGDLQG